MVEQIEGVVVVRGRAWSMKPIVDTAADGTWEDFTESGYAATLTFFRASRAYVVLVEEDGITFQTEDVVIEGVSYFAVPTLRVKATAAQTALLPDLDWIDWRLEVQAPGEELEPWYEGRATVRSETPGVGG